MRIVELLAYLRGQGVRLWVEGERLRYSAPSTGLTPELRAQIVERRAELIAFLSKAAAARPVAPPLQPVPRDGPLPLSYAQQRLWFLAQLMPDSSFYNMSAVVRLTGALDLAALEQGVDALMRRHEVLRTTFALIDGRPVQVIAPPDAAAPLPPPVDLRGLPDDLREAEAVRHATAAIQHPFELGCGPLVRLALLRVGDREHVLALTMHHIISDGWSIDIFIRELAALYAGYAGGRSAALPDLPVQYADYAIWQREWLNGAGEDGESPLQAQLGYWKGQLAGAPDVLALPLDRSRPAVQTFRGARHNFALPARLSEDLAALARGEGATLFMLLLAAFQALLARYSGQADIVVGAPIAGRTRAQTRDLIGCFVNTLVLRTDLSGDPTFRELLGRVRETCVGAYAHQDLPFERLVEELQLQRDLSRTPLVQVAFALQSAPMPAIELPGLTLSPVPVTGETAKFDLTLTVVEGQQGLAGWFEYNTDLLDATTIGRMIGHFETLLAAIVVDHALPVSALPILTEAERRQQAAWNATDVAYPTAPCLHELVAAQAARTPDAVALAFDHQEPRTKNQEPRTKNQEPSGEDSGSQFSVLGSEEGSQFSYVTYRDLDRRANQLAHELRALGVGPDVPVAVCMERSVELVVGLLAILKAGGAYLPLDPGYPVERLRLMLEDSGAPVLLTTQEQRTKNQEQSTTDRKGVLHTPLANHDGAHSTTPLANHDGAHSTTPLANHDGAHSTTPPAGDDGAHSTTPPAGDERAYSTTFDRTVIDLVSGWERIARQPETNVDSGVTPGNLAYIIYTSGSTGAPKGVMVPHRGIVNRLLWMQATYQLSATDRVLQKTPYSFDVSVWEFFWPLLAGATLVLARPGGQRDPAYLAELIRSAQISTLHFVPAMLQVFLEEPGAGRCGIPTQGGAGLRRVICSGEALGGELQQRFFERLGPLGAELHNLYGPTEASVDVTAWACRPAAADAPVPIGRPVANAQIWLLDDHMRPVPAGVAGELYIGGVQLARGYLGRPDLTAERFVPSPLSVVSGQLQRTTDNGLLTTDNKLYRTGDLCRYRSDGAIEYLGRRDFQVKLRGFRIELGEIAAVLDQHGAVRESLVVLQPAGEQPARLVAYLVPDDEQAAPLRRLLRWQREGRLADRRTYELPNGMVVLAQNPVETDFMYQEIFEARAYLRQGITLPDDACVFDVGANIGLFSLLVGQACARPVVYAFEPVPALFELLRLNLALYGLDARPFACGLAETARTAALTYYPHVSILSGRFADQQEERAAVLAFLRHQQVLDDLDGAALDELLAERLRGERVLCQFRTVSEIIREQGIERIDLLKIDVEKSELDVLAGIAAEDWPKIRQVVVEVHDVGGRLAQVRAIFEQRGYRVAVEQDGALQASGLYNLYAIGPAVAGPVAAGVPEERRSSAARLIQDATAWARERLPEYMVPAAFVLLDALPLTAHGKLDRRALPPPESSRPALKQTFVAPETPVEQSLAAIWAEVLRLDRVGIHDTFFALGGDSIRTVQVAARARERGLPLSVQQIFQHQTIHTLAQAISSTEATAFDAPQSAPFSLAAPEDRPLLPDTVEDAYPLTRLQLGMLFHAESSPEASVYQDVGSLLLRGRFEAQAIRAALAQLVARHPVLRTSFALTGFRAPLQLVHRAVELPLQIADLRHLAPAEQEQALEAWFAAQQNAPFQLERAPLIRFQVHWRSETTFQFGWSVHHAILDGWSLAAMLTEVCRHYLFLLRAAVPPIGPAPGTTFRQYVALERQALELQECRRYWAAKLADAEVTMLPRLRATGAEPAARQARMRAVPLAPALSDELRRLAEAAGVPLKSVLLAGHMRVLSLAGGRQAALTGLVAHGRPEEAAGAQVLGLFLNTLPFRLDLRGGTWLDLVRETFAAERELLPFRRYPLPEIQPLMGGQALSETCFNFNHFHIYQPLLDWEGLELVAARSFLATNFTFSALFTLDPATSQLQLSFEYDAAALCEEQIDALAGYYVRALTAMARRPEQRYESCDLLAAEERRRLLVDWNATAASYPQDQRLHTLVEAQAARTPDAVALVFDHQEPEQRTKNKEQRIDTPRNTHHATRNSFLNSQFSILNSQQHMTYGELNRRANQLAHHLRRLGVGPDTRVGIHLERSPALVVALLATLKAGGAYLPLAPDYPAERLAWMLDDAQVAVLLTDQEQRTKNQEQSATDRKGVLHTPPADHGQAEHTPPVDDERAYRPSPQQTVVDLVSDWPTIAQQPAENPACVVAAEDLAYIIYTSGSTGRPKGVMVPHRAIVNHLYWMQATFPLMAGDRVVQNTSFSFDVSVWEFFGPLAWGAQLVLLSPDDHHDSTALVETIRQRQVTILQLVPALLAVLLDTPGFSGCASLRHVFCGGEALPFELQERFLTLLGARLHHMYGPTETAIDAICWSCERGGQRRPLPIGRPLGNTQAYVLDVHMQPAPIGVPGELYIGGAGLARGYLGRPELTAERFVPSPLSVVSGQLQPATDNGQWTTDNKLYKTGDQCRYRPDGAIEYLGRLDQQVKLRGFRIELGEIEAVLAQHGAVREAVVVAGEDRPGERRLVAYVVPDQEQRTKSKEQRSEESNSQFSILNSQFVGELRAFLKQKLPGYMVPATFVLLDALPLTPNGKVDRRALPAPDQGRPDLGAAFVAPRTPLEETLARLWADVLRWERVGVDDDFFELGGQSLLSIQLIARVRAAFQIDLPLRRLYEAPTVASLARVIVQALAEQAERGELPPQAALPALVPDPRRRHLPFPLTDVQQVYWTGRSDFFDLSTGGANVLMEHEFSDVPDGFVERFELALRRLIDRHEMLRAIILPDGEQQILAYVPPYRLEAVDLCEHEPAAAEAVLEAVRERMRLHKAPLDRWPLFEFRAYRLGERRVRMLARIELLLIDGTSRATLNRELVRLLADPTAELPPLECSYRDYVLAWLDFQNSPAYQRARDYWLKLLPALPPAPELPLAQEIRPSTPSQFVDRDIIALDGAAWAQVKTLASRVGLTPSSVVVAAFAEVLAAWSAGPRFTIGLIGSDRPPFHPQIGQIVAHFNTFVLLTVEDGPGSFVERARRLQEQRVTHLDHRSFSGCQAVQELNRRRNRGPHAPMPVCFNSVLDHHLPYHMHGLEEAEAARATMPYQFAELAVRVYTPQVVLAPTVRQLGDGSLICQWQAVEVVFPDGLMQQMLDAYVLLLRRLATEEVAWRETAPVAAPSACYEQWRAALTLSPERGRRPQPEPAPIDGEAGTAPRDELERQLIALWEAILEVQGIGVADDFFDLGGNSFLAVRLLVGIQKHFGVELPLAALYAGGTVAYVAGMLRR